MQCICKQWEYSNEVHSIEKSNSLADIGGRYPTCDDSDEASRRAKRSDQLVPRDDSDEASRRTERMSDMILSDDSDESSRQVSTVVPVVSNEHDKSSSRGSTAALMVIDDHDGVTNRCLESAQLGDGTDDKSRPTDMVSDESRSRNARCSMSGMQQAEQLATPVIQGGGIDTTVVNKHNIDGCCVTNKCKCFKQNS